MLAEFFTVCYYAIELSSGGVAMPHLITTALATSALVYWTLVVAESRWLLA